MAHGPIHNCRHNPSIRKNTAVTSMKAVSSANHGASVLCCASKKTKVHLACRGQLQHCAQYAVIWHQQKAYSATRPDTRMRGGSLGCKNKRTRTHTYMPIPHKKQHYRVHPPHSCHHTQRATAKHLCLQRCTQLHQPLHPTLPPQCVPLPKPVGTPGRCVKSRSGPCSAPPWLAWTRHQMIPPA